MKTYLSELFKSINNLLLAFIFFFSLSFTGKTPYSVFELACISLAFSVFVISIGIFVVRYGAKG